MELSEFYLAGEIFLEFVVDITGRHRKRLSCVLHACNELTSRFCFLPVCLCFVFGSVLIARDSASCD